MSGKNTKRGYKKPPVKVINNVILMFQGNTTA
jgi:hypothetical protein